jgi:2-phospho-L-lactate guanylyltransferase
MILIPVKDLRSAKQRLASILDQASRTALAQAMIHDVLDAIANSTRRQEVAVVTNDPFAAELAHHFNFQIIRDHANASETAAIAMATTVCESQGADSALVIPGDIPLIQSSELDAIFAAAPENGSVLVPAADGRGTNAALRKPANLFPLQFGNDSFTPHLKSARATGRPCIVLSFPGIALDVDNPSDLQTLIEAPGQTRSQCLARQWQITEYPLAVNE